MYLIVLNSINELKLIANVEKFSTQKLRENLVARFSDVCAKAFEHDGVCKESQILAFLRKFLLHLKFFKILEFGSKIEQR